MKATHGMVVSLRYTLRDEEGVVIDSSEEQAPLAYLHGYHNIVPGLERALEGAAVGYHSLVVVNPEDGYGDHDPEQVFEVPREQFSDDNDLVPGAAVYADTPQGPIPYTVIDVKPEIVVLDGNHPLAGVTLHFDVEVVHIRPATQDELGHGHAHGEGGHHHH